MNAAVMQPESTNSWDNSGVTVEFRFVATKEASVQAREERSLGWDNDVRCVLQVFLLNERARALKLRICASQDRDGARFWKNETLREE
jgi:hypothetical protein